MKLNSEKHQFLTIQNPNSIMQKSGNELNKAILGFFKEYELIEVHENLAELLLLAARSKNVTEEAPEFYSNLFFFSSTVLNFFTQLKTAFDNIEEEAKETANTVAKFAIEREEQRIRANEYKREVEKLQKEIDSLKKENDPLTNDYILDYRRTNKETNSVISETVYLYDKDYKCVKEAARRIAEEENSTVFIYEKVNTYVR